MRDFNMNFEHLAKKAFDCDSRRGDPLQITDADEADEFFAGTLSGKKSVSAIIVAFMIKAQQKSMQELVSKLRELYDKIWLLDDRSSLQEYVIEDRIEIMDSIKAIATDILNEDFYY